MSIENKKSEITSQFPATYPTPGNQAEYQNELTDSIKSSFPDASLMLERNIDELKKYAHTAGSAALALRIPKPEETQASAAYVVRGGDEVPLETVAILGGLYALTGAEITEENTEKGVRQVIRKGQYGGRPVYFRERHSVDGDSEPIFEVDVAHEDNVLNPEALFAKRYPQLGELIATYNPNDKSDS